MISTFSILTIIYAVLVTLILLYSYKANSTNSLKNIEKKIEDSELDLKESTMLLISLEQAKNAQIPWYVKSISTVGVVVFISMVVATSVQTVKATIESYQVSKLQEQINQLNKQEKKSLSIVSSITDILFSTYAQTGTLPPSGKQILQYRLEQLKLENNKDNNKEIFKISMLVSDFESAISIIKDNKSDYSDINIIDQVSLSQYYYITGNASLASKMLRNPKKNISSLSLYWQTQVTVLEYILDQDKDNKIKFYVNRISRLLKKSYQDSEVYLLKEVGKYKKSIQNQN